MNDPLPNLQARVFAALCDDILDGAPTFRRLDALRSIQRADHANQGTPGVGNHPAANNRPEQNQ